MKKTTSMLATLVIIIAAAGLTVCGIFWILFWFSVAVQTILTTGTFNGGTWISTALSLCGLFPILWGLSLLIE